MSTSVQTTVPSTSEREAQVHAIKTRRKDASPIVMLTAYDAVSARIAQQAGVDLILVGDSAATTVLGYQYTREIQREELLMLTRAVRRGAPESLLVGDLPFGSYEYSDREAVAAASDFMMSGCDFIKLEGAGTMLSRVRAIIGARIPVIGHVGLLPQSAQAPGDLRARGRTAEDAVQVLEDAIALERAGCSAIVIEAVPSIVAETVYHHTSVPIIGIGAGHQLGGQVLVFHDLLGLSEPPLPKFVREYAHLGGTATEAINRYAADVRSRAFPSAVEEYGMPAAEREKFAALLEERPSSSHL